MSCEKIITEDGQVNNQSFSILELRHKPTGNLLTVVCIHLKSKKAHAEKRRAQIDFILKSVIVHCSKHKDLKSHPLIFCGDFNGQPYEAFYKLITENDQLNLKDVYSQYVDKKEPTTIKCRESVWIKREIDYIFFTENSLQVLSYLELPKDEKLIEEQGLPNEKYSSDHLSLVCDFCFK